MNIPETTIRPFTANDFDQSINIIKQSWDINIAKKASKNLLEKIDLQNGYCFSQRFICETNKLIVGICGAYTLVTTPHGFIGIDWFAVLPEYRQRGIGTQLLNKFYDIGKENKFSTAFVWTSKAVGFYEKNGFLPSTINIIPVESTILMTKSL